jgi:hypothetical protein
MKADIDSSCAGVFSAIVLKKDIKIYISVLIKRLFIFFTDFMHLMRNLFAKHNYRRDWAKI